MANSPTQTYILLPYFPGLLLANIKPITVFYQENSDTFSMKKCKKPVNKIDGIYLTYREGTFIFFKTYDNQLKIGWRHQILDFEQIASMKHSFDGFFKGYHLRCFDRNHQTLMDVYYHSPFRNLVNPFTIFDWFFPDDWDLCQDLPGETFAFHKNVDNNQRIARMNENNDYFFNQYTKLKRTPL